MAPDTRPVRDPALRGDAPADAGARVVPRYERWLERFPTLDALAARPLADVLEEWQGLGYNRRAVSLKRAADEVVAERYAGQLPADEAALRGCPASAPRRQPACSRSRSRGRRSTSRRTSARCSSTSCSPTPTACTTATSCRSSPQTVADAVAEGVSPREWYYALLDYGAWLKRTVPNPSRRSAHHVRQSPFEGSQRQKRARLLRAVMRAGVGREPTSSPPSTGVEPALRPRASSALAAEGFLAAENDVWRIAE